jgi:hypothetical protein
VRVPLPDDNWADIRDVGSLTGEDESVVKGAVKVRGRSGDDTWAMSGVAVAMEFAMLRRVLTDWSFPQPITAESIRALPLSTLRPLRTAIKPHMLEMRDDEDPNPDGESLIDTD